jgi:hypothetical protein
LLVQGFNRIGDARPHTQNQRTVNRHNALVFQAAVWVIPAIALRRARPPSTICDVTTITSGLAAISDSAL